MTSGDVGAKTRRRRGAQSQAGMEDGEDRPCKGPEAGPGPEQSSETSVARAEWGVEEAAWGRGRWCWALRSWRGLYFH